MEIAITFWVFKNFDKNFSAIGSASEMREFGVYCTQAGSTGVPHHSPGDMKNVQLLIAENKYQIPFVIWRLMEYSRRPRLNTMEARFVCFRTIMACHDTFISMVTIYWWYPASESSPTKRTTTITVTSVY